jgi:hypothetical protein
MLNLDGLSASSDSVFSAHYILSPSQDRELAAGSCWGVCVPGMGPWGATAVMVGAKSSALYKKNGGR